MPEAAPQAPRDGERPSARAGAPPRPSRSATGRKGGSRERWLLYALAALAVAAVVLLSLRVVALQNRNRELVQDLATTRAELQAHRDHLAGARERAGDLRGRLDELEAWLARDPGE